MDNSQTAIVGSYEPWLVVLSVIVVTVYAALQLSLRIARVENGNTRRLWLSGGAIAMGSGIWSMHFIGMLAYQMPGLFIQPTCFCTRNGTATHYQ